jgi:hypothetical protein
MVENYTTIQDFTIKPAMVDSEGKGYLFPKRSELIIPKFETNLIDLKEKKHFYKLGEKVKFVDKLKRFLK